MRALTPSPWSQLLEWTQDLCITAQGALLGLLWPSPCCHPCSQSHRIVLSPILLPTFAIPSSECFLVWVCVPPKGPYAKAWSPGGVFGRCHEPWICETQWEVCIGHWGRASKKVVVPLSVPTLFGGLEYEHSLQHTLLPACTTFARELNNGFSPRILNPRTVNLKLSL